MGKVVLYGSVSVDGYISDEQDQPEPLFDWRTNGDVALGADGQLRVTPSSYDYTQSYWDRIGVTIAGRRVFALTDGWGGAPPSGVDHMVIVTRRPPPEGWGPRGSFFFADGVEAAVARAQDLAPDRIVEVAAGDVGGQAFAAGFVDEMRMDIAPVALGAGHRFFGSVDAMHSLGDPRWLPAREYSTCAMTFMRGSGSMRSGVAHSGMLKYSHSLGQLPTCASVSTHGRCRHYAK